MQPALNLGQMINLHLPQDLNTEGIRLRIYDFMMLGAQHNEVLISIPFSITQRYLPPRPLTAVSNNVCQFCNHGPTV